MRAPCVGRVGNASVCIRSFRRRKAAQSPALALPGDENCHNPIASVIDKATERIAEKCGDMLLEYSRRMRCRRSLAVESPPFMSAPETSSRCGLYARFLCGLPAAALFQRQQKAQIVVRLTQWVSAGKTVCCLLPIVGTTRAPRLQKEKRRRVRLLRNGHHAHRGRSIRKIPSFCARQFSQTTGVSRYVMLTSIAKMPTGAAIYR